MAPQRYYAQYISEKCLPTGFPGWHILDREYTDKQGECLPIARCNTRYVAFKIRDLLNKQEEPA